ACLIILLLVHYVTPSPQDVQVVCGANVTLPCRGIDIKQGNFVSVAWYKVKARFGQDYSLTLFGVTPEDSGTYACAINAKVGGQNQCLNAKYLYDFCVGCGFTGLLCAADISSLTHTSGSQCVKESKDTEAHLSVFALKLLKSAFSKMAVHAFALNLSLFSSSDILSSCGLSPSKKSLSMSF
uniref:Ig-like domain-containing protein n=1 Tax=Salarias fasciatus TaxID=181472 RepID=A0A672IS72_SALFA